MYMCTTYTSMVHFVQGVGKRIPGGEAIPWCAVGHLLHVHVHVAQGGVKAC